MFEVGKLVARIALEGAETFKRDVKAVGDEFSGLSDKGKRAATEVGAGLTLVGAGILSLVGLAVAKFAEFDKSMSQVKAASGATGAELESLRQTALDMGADTKYSATEAAAGIVQLSKAGIQADDIIGGGLAGSLSLAAAGEISVADAAETAATAMTQFHLAGSQIPHLADLLAAGAGKAQGGVADLSMALKQGGLVASQMGLSVEDTVGTLTAFASAGLLGSDAGTSFRTMLLSLANPSSKAAATLKEYNINAYDSEGHFVSMQDLAGQLQSKLGGLSEETRNAALATIFGSDAIRAASVLYAEGAKGIGEWTDAVNDSGYAARQAAELQDNLAGDVEKLGGAFDTALIQSGAALNDVLRDMVQMLTGLVDWYGQLPEPVQQGAVVLGLFAGGLALVAGSLLILIPRIVDFRASIKTLGSELPGLTGKAKSFASFLGGPWGVALAAAGLAMAALNAEIQNGVPTSNEIANALDTAASSADVFATAAKRSGLETAIWGDYADGLKDLPGLLDQIGNDGFDWLNLSLNEQGTADSIKRVGQALADLAGTNLPAAQAQFRKMTQEYDLNQEQQIKLLETMGPYRDALVAQASAQKINVTSGTELENNLALLGIANGDTKIATDESTESNKTAAQAYLETTDQAGGLVDMLTQLIDTVNAANGVGQDAVSTNATYQASLAAVAETIAKAQAGAEGYSTSIDEQTAAGSANAEMFRGLAADSQAAASSQYDLDLKTMSAKDATDKYMATLASGRQTLYDQILALTGNADAAQALTDKIYGIPDEHTTQIIAETAQAAQDAQAFLDLINSVPEVRRTTIGVTVETDEIFRIPQANGSIRQADGGVVRYYAGGGMENHVAQIARAGEWRVWAEDETGGEAYIPLAPSKRDRSTAILEETAALFGLRLVPAGVGSEAAPTSGSSASLTGMRIAGTLDLGNGLRGMVDAVVMEALDSESDDAKAGAR